MGRKAFGEVLDGLVDREKFAKHIMVSAGVCFEGKGRIHFVDEKANVDALYYVSRLLPQLIEDCKQLMPARFIFQQDGAPAHTARITPEWLHANCPEIIEKDRWLTDSPDLNPFDYHVWGAMLEKYQKLQPKAEAKDNLKAALQLIWDDMSEPINKAVKDFTKRLKAWAVHRRMSVFHTNAPNIKCIIIY